MKQWYVLQVLTGDEGWVTNRLVGRGYDAMIPSRILPERRMGVWRDVQRLLFPGYVFVGLPGDIAAQDYYRIRSIPQIVRILGDGRPTPISGAEAA